MCGLFGFIHSRREKLEPPLAEAGRRALHTLSHRGPDQWDEMITENVYHGHRRLSILDLSDNGRQPMISEDGDVAISVNGEIYNHTQLRHELGEAMFRSGSDSEAILHGYRRWGLNKLLDKIDGMYAIIIHDRANGQLHLIRDRAGVKPLFYARIGDFFVWASELKALTAFFDREKLAYDKYALYDFLTYRYIPAPGTAYRGICKLQAAHSLTIDTKSGRYGEQQRYWQLPAHSETHNHEHAAQHLRILLGKSVEEQLMSDVPLGFFLSGGIDSSILVALAAQTRSELATFSIGYEPASHDETSYADAIAAHFGTTHYKQVLQAGDSADLPARILGWYDEPFADSSALPTWHVSRFTRQHATVALSGDGADELFGGYRWYWRYTAFRAAQAPLRWLSRKGPRTAIARHLKGKLERIATRIDLYSHFDGLELYAALLGGVTGPEKQRWAKELEIENDYDSMWHFRRFDHPELGRRKRLQYIDFHTFLPDDILTKVDRASMTVSLEARVPYLSRDVMEYAATLPEDFHYSGKTGKGGLKYAFADLLPDRIWQRPKKGFSIPMQSWAGESMQGYTTLEEAVLQRFLNEGGNGL